MNGKYITTFNDRQSANAVCCRLEKEERGGNWLYNIDQLAPLEIYD